MKTQLLVFILVLFSAGCCLQRLFNVCGGVQGIQCPEGFECEIENKDVSDSFGKCVPVNSTAEPAVCQLGVVYEDSIDKDVECKCPEGYKFDYNIIGYSGRDGVESPIMGLECKPENQ